MDDRFGPCTSVVEWMLERAGRITEPEATSIFEAQVKVNADELQFRAALQAVVHTSHYRDRQRFLLRAENAGRTAVTVFPGTAMGEAIAGYVGRLAEALVVSDAVDEQTLVPLTKPWQDVIGPLGLEKGDARSPRRAAACPHTGP